ncbi:MAG: sulfotransferase [Cyclobacteriaceae bacterium]|nr:sulfotransferase [Cyclobacteriaceae bacterium]
MNSSPVSSTDTKIVFFLGTHRTGTQLIANFFDQGFANVKSCHQLSSHKLLNILSTLMLHGYLPSSLFNSAVDFLLARRLRRMECSTYIETTGWNYVAAKRIIQTFPDVRVIHLVRDPREFVPSYLNVIRNRRKSWIASYLVPFWTISAVAVGALGSHEWANMTPFDRLCWTWAYKNQYLENTYKSENYLLLRLEDLTNPKSRSGTLATLFAFIDIPLSEGDGDFLSQRHNTQFREEGETWRRWPMDKCQRLHNICGDLMSRYGYGTEIEWQNKLRKVN